MLAQAHRLRARDDFRTTIRRGKRIAAKTLVVHVRPEQAGGRAVGFVVSKAVGNAVVRNRVKRRLRHLMAARLDLLAPHISIVVRALPPAADAASGTLARDLDRVLDRSGAVSAKPVRAAR